LIPLCLRANSNLPSGIDISMARISKERAVNIFWIFELAIILNSGLERAKEGYFNFSVTA